MSKQSILRLAAAIITGISLLLSQTSQAQDAQFVIGNVNSSDTVKGVLIHSTTNGVKFPDNTVQTSAAGIVRGTGTAIVNNLGGGNHAVAPLSLIASGKNDSIYGNADYAVILGGKNNVIENQITGYSSSTPAPANPGAHNFISGGEFNRIKPNANHSSIIGGANNIIAAGAANSVILGGSNITASEPNTVYMQKATVTSLAGTGTRFVGVDSNGNFVTPLQPVPVVPDCPGCPAPGVCGHPSSSDAWHYRTDPAPSYCGITTMNWVGIGTYSPEAKLEIVSDQSSGMTNALGVYNSVRDPLFLVRDGGRVGIGTKFPEAKFDIHTSGGNFRFDGSGSGGYTSSFVMDNTGLKIGHNSQIRNIDFSIRNTSIMTLNSSGVVRIGLPTGPSITNNVPLGRLEVLGFGTSSTTTALNVSDNAGNSLFKVNDDGKISIGVPNDRMTDLNNAPGTQYKLYVGGGIMTEFCRVALMSDRSSWGDWVFDENNKRMSFTEQLIFYKKNKHLIGIPSAIEIKSKGIDVAEMFTGIVVNLEEARLDNISLYQENQEQKREIEKIRAELDDMKKQIEHLRNKER